LKENSIKVYYVNFEKKDGFEGGNINILSKDTNIEKNKLEADNNKHFKIATQKIIKFISFDDFFDNFD
jgi:hypothetical protein